MGGKEMTLLIVLTEADNYDDRMIGRAIVPREKGETTETTDQVFKRKICVKIRKLQLYC